MNPSQATGQPSFFYYNPEPNTEHRQHGHFSQHTAAGHGDAQPEKHLQQFYHPGMMMPGQQPTMYPHLPSSTAPCHHEQILVTPRPLLQKPAFLGSNDSQTPTSDTECSTPDLYVFPSAPTLSVSGSETSNPPSTCDILPTPTTAVYMNIGNIEGVKEGCEVDVKSEILAGGDWTRCYSPPLTPSK